MNEIDRDTVKRARYFTEAFFNHLHQRGWSKDVYVEVDEHHPFSRWGMKVFVLPKDKKVESKVDAACLSFARELPHEVDVETEVSYERLTGGTYIVIECNPAT